MRKDRNRWTMLVSEDRPDSHYRSSRRTYSCTWYPAVIHAKHTADLLDAVLFRRGLERINIIPLSRSEPADNTVNILCQAQEAFLLLCQL